ncbi:MAG: rane assembly protein AsmA [Bacteroidetes bacterium]|nr:rane assembly protein AsmA [Bacteroidota bacterium]
MLKKILIGFAIFIVLFIVALIAVPYLFKDQINLAIKTEINKQIKAKVDYTGYDLSLIRSFPNLSFGMSNLTVIGVDDFKKDTLISVKDFRVVLDIMTVIKGQKYKVKQLVISQPKIYAVVNKAGQANWDITKPTKEKTGSSGSNFALEINKYKIENGYIVYDDQKGGTYLSIGDLNFEGSGDVTQDLYKLSTQTKIASLTFRSGAVSYLSEAKIDAKNDVDVDQKNSKYTFAKNEIDINDLGLLFDGFVQMNKKDIGMNVTFKSKKAEFKSILSLIPAIFKKDFDKIKTSGSLALDGQVKGSYDSTTLPGIKLNLKVDNAMFQYPSLPSAVTGINIAANVDKPQGSADLTVVDISKLHLNIANDPIDATIHISTPVSDPNVAAKINGKLDLASVPKLYPMEGLEQLTGLMVAALEFKGRMSDVQKKNYQAIQASGNLKVTNMVYDSKQTPMAVKVSSLGLTFNPQKVSLDNLNAVLGKSDISATGAIDNLIGYLFNKGELGGYIALKSNQFDANEWLVKNDNTTSTAQKSPADPKSTTKAPAGGPQYFDVPKGIDFTAKSEFGKILYDKMVLTNVKGTIRIFDESINLSDLFANLLGGSATISALYDTKGTKNPKVTFSYDIKNFDMQQTYNAVGMAAKMAPVMKYLQGTFASNLSGTGSLKEDMSVDYNSLQGNGKVQIPSAKVVGLPILQKIADATKVKSLDNLAITNAWTTIKFQNGRVNVDPTDLKFGNGYNMNVQGSNGFDETIDYDVRFDIPSKELTSVAGGLISQIPQIPGVPFKMPETINVTLKVGGTVAKPTVSIGKVGGAGGSAKDVIKSTVDDAKKKVEDAAKQQADALKKQAQEQADKAAKDAADKLKNATKGIKLPF